MDDLGYYISSRSFKGPFLTVAEIRADKPVVLMGLNLYCVKKELRNAIAAAGGGRRGAARRLTASGLSTREGGLRGTQRQQGQAAGSTHLVRS